LLSITAVSNTALDLLARGNGRIGFLAGMPALDAHTGQQVRLFSNQAQEKME
jgi:hypothetical protein